MPTWTHDTMIAQGSAYVGRTPPCVFFQNGDPIAFWSLALPVDLGIGPFLGL
jgi:hypothetical protein